MSHRAIIVLNVRTREHRFLFALLEHLLVAHLLLLLEELDESELKDVLHALIIARTALDVRRLETFSRPLAVQVIHLPLARQIALTADQDHGLKLRLLRGCVGRRCPILVLCQGCIGRGHVFIGSSFIFCLG